MSGLVRGAARGTCAAGFEGVREVFCSEVLGRGDAGAFAVVVEGRLVVNLFGGVADERSGEPWGEHTACVLFSGSKGVVATLLVVLAARGDLALDAPVATVWPEFGAAGKEGITVAQLAAHAGGLPGVEARLDASDLARPEPIEALLAAQAPLVPPGAPCYHALTHGWLCGALVRRRTGASLGRLLADELVGPLELELGLGAAGAGAVRGVAPVRPAPDYRLSAYLEGTPDPRLALVYQNPPLPVDAWNDPALRALEVPAVNAVGTAEALARLYGSLVAGELVPPAAVARAGRPESAGPDPLTGRPLRFGPTGYELAGTPSALGPPPDAFGHTGTGGSSHGGWPALRTGFSFVTADLRREDRDGRARALLDELHAAVAA